MREEQPNKWKMPDLYEAPEPQLQQNFEYSLEENSSYCPQVFTKMKAIIFRVKVFSVTLLLN